MQYDENSCSFWQLVIGSFITTICPLMHHISSRVFSKTSSHPGDSGTDLAPWDFWLFPKLKLPLKGKRFQTVCETQENMTGQLMAIPTKDFTDCFEWWKRCLENCVRSQAAYFERDWGIIIACTRFLVSWIFFSKCLCISKYVAEKFLDRPCILQIFCIHLK